MNRRYKGELIGLLGRNYIVVYEDEKGILWIGEREEI